MSSSPPILPSLDDDQMDRLRRIVAVLKDPERRKALNEHEHPTGHCGMWSSLAFVFIIQPRLWWFVVFFVFVDLSCTRISFSIICRVHIFPPYCSEYVFYQDRDGLWQWYRPARAPGPDTCLWCDADEERARRNGEDYARGSPGLLQVEEYVAQQMDEVCALHNPVADEQ